jgi:hypothetical protein
MSQPNKADFGFEIGLGVNFNFLYVVQVKTSVSWGIILLIPFFLHKIKNVRGGGGGYNLFPLTQIFSFCDLNPNAKFRTLWQPLLGTFRVYPKKHNISPPSGRKVCDPEEKETKTKKNKFTLYDIVYTIFVVSKWNWKLEWRMTLWIWATHYIISFLKLSLFRNRC